MGGEKKGEATGRERVAEFVLPEKRVVTSLGKKEREKDCRAL